MLSAKGTVVGACLTANVRNLGPAEVVAPSVRFYDGHPDSGGVLITGRLIPNILGGETATVHCRWSVSDTLPRMIWIQVDQENAIQELNEWNNLAGRLFDVTSDLADAERLPKVTDLFPPAPTHSLRGYPFASLWPKQRM
jgi:hypothetical protein